MTYKDYAGGITVIDMDRVDDEFHQSTMSDLMTEPAKFDAGWKTTLKPTYRALRKWIDALSVIFGLIIIFYLSIPILQFTIGFMGRLIWEII
jgi:hypothetical protein